MIDVANPKGRSLTPTDDPAVELREVASITSGAEIRRYIAPRIAKILDRLADLAEQGDARSAEALLKYLPPPRQESEKFVIPGFASARTLTEKASAIEQAVASGAISFDAGQKAMQMIGVVGQAVGLDEVRAQLAAILKGQRDPALRHSDLA